MVVECQDSGEVHEVSVTVSNPDDEQALHDAIEATGACGEEYFYFGEPACTETVRHPVVGALPWKLRFRCQTRQGKILWATVEGRTCGEAEAKGQRIIRYAAIKWHGGVKQGTQPECTILVRPVGAPGCGNCR